MSRSWRRSATSDGHRAAHRFAQLARAPRGRVAAQLERLAVGEQQDRRDRLRELEDAAAIARGDRAHADLVLVVALGAARERRGGHRELQRLGGQRGGRDPHRLEAVVAAAVRREILRQAAARRGRAEQLHLAVEQIGDARHRALEPVHRERHVPAVEVAAVQHRARVGVDDRVVVHAVELDLHRLGRERERIEQHADHVRRAAHRVDILQARRLQPGDRLEVFADPRGRAPRARVRLQLEDRAVEVARVARDRAHGHRGERARPAREARRALDGETRERRHHAGAVHQREALLRLELERRKARARERVGRLHHLAAHERLALAHEQRRDVGERREIAARTDRPLFGNPRQDAAIGELAQALEHDGPHARITARERGEPRHHDGGGFLAVEDAARAAAVEAQQVLRDELALRLGHLAPLRRAHPGGDTVDRHALAQRRLERAAPGLEPGAIGRIALELEARAVARDGHDVGHGERREPDRDHLSGRVSPMPWVGWCHRRRGDRSSVAVFGRVVVDAHHLHVASIARNGEHDAALTLVLVLDAIPAVVAEVVRVGTSSRSDSSPGRSAIP